MYNTDFIDDIRIHLQKTYSDFGEGNENIGENMIGDLYIEFTDNSYIIISHSEIEELERFWCYKAMNIDAEYLWKIKLCQLVDNTKRIFEGRTNEF